MSEHGKKGKRSNKAASKTRTYAPLRADDAMHESQELREKLRRLEAILEGTRAGTWEWNVQTGETVFNERWAEIAGYTLAELAPVSIKTWESLAHPEDFRRSGELLARYFAGELAYYECDCRMRHKDGRWVWVRDRGKVVSRTPDGQPLWMFGTHIDITERKRTEEKLRESEELYRSIFRDHSAAKLLIDASTGQILDANPAAIDFYGYTYDQLTALRIWDINTLGEQETRQRMAAARDGSARQFEFQHRLASGQLRRVQVLGGSIVVAGKTLLNSIIVDITDRQIAEAALRESHARYELVLEGAGGGIWDWDVPNRRVHFSPRWKQIRGYAANEISDSETEWSENIHPEDAPRVMAAVREHFEGRTVVFEEEYRVRRKDGSYLWILDRGKAVRDADGQVVRMAGSEIDITERKQAEEKLRASEAMLSASQRIGHVGSWVLELSSGQLTWSDEVYRIFGIEPQAFGATYEAFLDRVHPDDRSAVDAAYTASSRERRDAYEIEHRIVRPDTGEVRHVHERGHHEYDAAGDVLRSVGMVEDITERKQTEEALRRNNKDLKESQRIAHVGSWRLDVATNQVVWTEELYNMYGFDPSVPPPPYTEHMKLFTPESWERLSTALARTRETGIPYTLELETVRKDGSNGWMWVRGEADVDSTGKTVGLWGAAQDITERKQAEEEKEKLQARFAQVQKMESVGRLAGGVAHDFNNMLTVILGHVVMAMEQVDPAQPLFADLQEVRNAAERSADLTRQLLGFARKQTVAPKVLDLNETVSGMLKMLQCLIGENVDLAWLPGKDPGPVKMDPSQIDQILVNLCVNARDAIPGVGKVTIETGAAAFDEAYCAAHAGFAPGDYVLLAVSDNGCGMDAETLGHLFEPFFTTKELGRGTGLGLATVYGTVTQNNGFINVYSEPGQGTTFRIYLPRYTAKADRPVEKGPDQPARRGHETILLVEDEPAILRMTTMMLERLGYAVTGAKTPGEAIRLANEHAGPLHLLMTDVVMPEMNGRDLAGNLLSVYPGIKRLFMSGYTANVIAHHGVLDEGVNFIQKPFSIKDLAAKLREVLDQE
jgi:PAS domain S-box-containing protein